MAGQGCRRISGTSAPGSDSPVCGKWPPQGRRRALVADVCIGTIDQAVMAVLPTRFSQQIFEHHVVEHRVRQKALQLRILVLELLQALGVR